MKEKETIYGDINKLKEMLTYNLPEPISRLFTIEEASDALGVSPQTLRNWEKDGMLVSQRTVGGHRRYTEEQITDLKKKRMADQEIILSISPTRLLETANHLLSAFDQNKVVTVSIRVNQFDRTVKFVVDSEDGLTTVVKTFKMEE